MTHLTDKLTDDVVDHFVEPIIPTPADKLVAGRIGIRPRDVAEHRLGRRTLAPWIGRLIDAERR